MEVDTGLWCFSYSLLSFYTFFAGSDCNERIMGRSDLYVISETTDQILMKFGIKGST
jgi:hypothetical protein